MTFRTAILAMRLNRKRLVVVLESELYIYDISNMQMLKTEKTSPNPNGMSRTWANSDPTDRRSYLCALRFIREQLPRVSAPYESCTEHIPAAVARAAQVGPCCAQ
jgi:hypothetical protein